MCRSKCRMGGRWARSSKARFKKGRGAVEQALKMRLDDDII